MVSISRKTFWYESYCYRRLTNMRDARPFSWDVVIIPHIMQFSGAPTISRYLSKLN